jgi:hypothetical protein
MLSPWVREKHAFPLGETEACFPLGRNPGSVSLGEKAMHKLASVQGDYNHHLFVALDK